MMYKLVYNELFEYYSFVKCVCYIILVLNKDLWRFLCYFREGKVVFYLFDQYYGMSNSVFVLFFGVMVFIIVCIDEFVCFMKCVLMFVMFGCKVDGYYIEVLFEFEFFIGDKVQDVMLLN